MSELDIEAFLNTHMRLVESIAGLSNEQLRWKATELSWSVTEVLAHLADHNIVVSFRIRGILADSKEQLVTFEQDQWVAGQHSNASEVSDILDLFGALLQYNRLLFNRLSEQELAKSGINFKGDTVLIRDIIPAFTNHVHHHIAQIERIKTAYLDQVHIKKGSE
ncbi:DinB family protein [Paenibacillus endoradicis]|uniref:DinB family protein n=1 Tax=Paenibacillus endoradicis TaxID=2972487 RepID=UPI00215983BE|nr:DinB family protein [Paenibacillus endoradicis]MCR8656203.1 DinB family protein [Paenibacillus endoradicis]